LLLLLSSLVYFSTAARLDLAWAILGVDNGHVTGSKSALMSVGLVY
jgi:hypothetical protein